MARPGPVLLGLATLAAGCTDPPAPGPEPASAAAAPSGARPADAVVPDMALAAPAGGRAACPPDMLLVDGAFCPAAEQRCLDADPDRSAASGGEDRCARFAAPSRCASSRRVLLRFCVDRYEWPNREGELPSVLVDFGEASAACAGKGKRLCEEREWLLACEGEEMLPYATGYRRDPEACAIDRPYVGRPRPLLHLAECLGSPTCRRDFERVDQRAPAGAHPSCASPFGAEDMNGNVNEWVELVGEKYPHRSGLKGGWWGPVRDRCRPTVRFHDESDWGYEIGFRCCGDALP